MFNPKKAFSRQGRGEKVAFDVHSICDGHHHVAYRGVKAIRCPFDYLLYQMILCDVMPDLVIEIGTNHGGGALYLADLMNNLDCGMVHTIDLESTTNPLVTAHPRIRCFTGGWQQYNLEAAREFSRILVIEDGAHTYEETLQAMLKFAPLVARGSYLIVEDGIIDELGMADEYHGGPLLAIREFLETHSEFSVDRNWCDFFGQNATFNVNGYLKKS
jgi:cephalosporin hydroxylase